MVIDAFAGLTAGLPGIADGANGGTKIPSGQQQAHLGMSLLGGLSRQAG